MKPFTTFDQTFKLSTFLMVIGLVYPNPKTNWIRLLLTLVLFAAFLPLGIIILLDVCRYFKQGDILEIVKHAAVAGPFFLGFAKMVLAYWSKDEWLFLINQINDDHANYNTLPEEYKKIVRDGIRKSKLMIRGWCLVLVIILLLYYGGSLLLTIYSQLFSSNPSKYMIYDINRPYMEPEARFESPFYEFITIYIMCMSVLYVINYSSYEIFMIPCINHAATKVLLFCVKIRSAMISRPEDLGRNIAEAVKFQCAFFNIIRKLDEAFGVYLGFIFLICAFQTCVCLYIISERNNTDVKFIGSIIGCMEIMFVPCYIGEKLQSLSQQSAIEIYNSAWENVQDPRVRKYVPLMIARAQDPVSIKGFSVFTFEMNLFVKTMKSAYSLYTLLKSQKH
uniref:Odorant receptor n=1 Tax=Heortia vitessoides TaxID=1557813 RepID=A0A978W735_9NEOP|nr:odorant receptor 38 [Heortia vitessoides]